MVNEDVLNVWYQGKLVGILWRNAAGIIGFRYEQTWVNNGFSISQQMPISTLEYPPESRKAHYFFVNLLPEADARMHIVRDLKISNSDFELLKAIGGECAGALSILPSSMMPSEKNEYSLLSDSDLKNLIRRKGALVYLNSRKDRPRLSLAGAQDKCAIFFDGENYFIPRDASPSSHILKFEVAGYRNIPVYEYFMMMLGRLVGLPVAQVDLKKTDAQYYLLIKRYDRVLEDNNAIKRLHQEDFCQALGFGYEKKYEQQGGPSFSECYRLAQNIVLNPIKDTENLLRWQIFNVLAGNSDAHAKNISLLYDKDNKVVLAPFYDLVCTRAIERIDKNLAFSIGGEFDPDIITLKHWERFASDCDIRLQYVLKLVDEMSELILDKFPAAIQEFEELHGRYPALQRVAKIVIRQCKRRLSYKK
jgi:serine/threonine-protein kinase HipA